MQSLKKILDIALNLNLSSKENQNNYKNSKEYFKGIEVASSLLIKSIETEIKAKRKLN